MIGDIFMPSLTDVSGNMKPLNDKHKKYLRVLVIVTFAPLILFLLLLLAISFGWFGEMPTVVDLETPQRSNASEVFSGDGKMVGTYYIENRNDIEYKDLSPYLVEALVAREDHRFYKHSGVDFVGLMRVLGKTVLLAKKGEGGGSTITQQLARNLFPRDTSEHFFQAGHMFTTKLKEWVIAIKLERKYSKDEIIAMYLNTVYFGNQAYGIKTGARTYFNKLPDALTIEQAALLIGVLKGTSLYDPKRNPKRALARRNSVLSKMHEHNYLSGKRLDSLKALPIKLDFHPQVYVAGLATYLREYIRVTMNRTQPLRREYSSALAYSEDSAKWADDPLFGWCNKNLKPDGSKYNLYKDGLKIYTTIDSRMQQYAEWAVTTHLSKTLQPAFFKVKKGMKKAPFANNLSDAAVAERMKIAMEHSEKYRSLRNEGLSKREILANFKRKTDMRIFTWKGFRDTILSPMDSIRNAKFYLKASFMAVDPHTGYVKAYVGGPDIRFFKYDGVMKQRRQIGSTIKPFLYTVALNDGYKPCDLVWNLPVTFKLYGNNFYTPKNDEVTPYDGKEVTLMWGLGHSVNNVAAYLLQQFQYQPVVDILRHAGVKSTLEEVPSFCLGISEFTVNEVVGAYTIFSNHGMYSQPMVVSHIEDKHGNLLTSFASKNNEVISAQTAYGMLQMLMGVVKNGTAARIPMVYNLRNEIGGKTGTTQNQSDGWFVGVTPDLVAGAWVGGDEPSIHFDRMSEGQGSSMALPIFALFMQKAYADKTLHLSQEPFEKPEGFDENTDCPTNKITEEPEASYLEDDF